MIIYWTREGRFEAEDWLSIPQNIVFHRIGAPAVMLCGKREMWYLDGDRHRVDGPAITLLDGRKWWYIFGIKLTEDEWEVDRHYDLAFLKLKYWKV